MCVDPITIAAAVASAAGGAMQANAQNQAAYNNADSANRAAERKYEDTQRKYVYDARAAQQEGYTAAMKSRQSIGTASASGGSSGIGGISLSNVIASLRQEGAENAGKIQTKQDDLRTSYTSAVDSYRAEAEARGMAIPMANPFMAAATSGLSILASGVRKTG